LLFDPGVKTSKRDLFDRERELEEIFDAVRNREKLIVVYGVRRVGKSSLVNTALREIGEPFAIIDVRALYFESEFRGVSESIIVETLLADLLPALKGRGFPLGGSLVPRIYSGLHLSFAGQSGWPEIPPYSVFA
jgi:AAA+ ATPase superfamily predicted ATPase